MALLTSDGIICLELADGGLLVVAGNVMPFDAIGVEVVQDTQAHFGLVDVAVLSLVAVVGLGALAPGTAGGGKQYFRQGVIWRKIIYKNFQKY